MSQTLESLGWKPVFQQQLDATADAFHVCRITEVQRSGVTILPALPHGFQIPITGRWFNLPADERPALGDWILVDASSGVIERVLERTTVIKRLAPDGEVQVIAANVDTAFVVTSCNQDFSLARIERYLVALMEFDIQPVVVITKADLSADAESYQDQVRQAYRDVMIELVNAKDADTLAGLRAWCGPGQSIALLGSSGVGKSTLVNTLSGGEVQQTSAAREGDDKGRHTTTHRSLHLLPSGAVIVDSPGMREFQVTDAESGVTALFDDIEQLAEGCRFNDCEHASEPGCAVRRAIEQGQLDAARLSNYFKLKREEQINSETVAERHARMRKFGKMVKQHTEKQQKKNQT